MWSWSICDIKRQTDTQEYHKPKYIMFTHRMVTVNAAFVIEYIAQCAQVQRTPLIRIKVICVYRLLLHCTRWVVNIWDAFESLSLSLSLSLIWWIIILRCILAKSENSSDPKSEKLCIITHLSFPVLLKCQQKKKSSLTFRICIKLERNHYFLLFKTASWRRIIS